jgi:hypothetical protein
LCWTWLNISSFLCIIAVTAFMGHNGSLRSISFSHLRSPEYSLLSTASDSTARLWRLSRVDHCSVLFSHWQHNCTETTLPSVEPISTLSTTTTPSTVNLSSRSNSSSSRKLIRNRPYGSDVKAAQFYYQDKFVLLASFVLRFLVRLSTDLVWCLSY